MAHGIPRPIPDIHRLNPKISAGTVRLIERMMAKKAGDRQQTPKDLLAEIAWLRSEAGPASTPIVPLDPPSVETQVAVTFDKGLLRLDTKPPRRVDCHIVADPVALFLVAMGLKKQWGPIATGKLMTWGTKPWLALQFVGFFATP